jgi:hypothetical protein
MLIYQDNFWYIRRGYKKIILGACYFIYGIVNADIFLHTISILKTQKTCKYNNLRQGNNMSENAI